jgi:hypothetical protein
MLNRSGASAAVVAVCLAIASEAGASTYNFGASGTGSDGAEGATAIITASLNSIEVQLTSTQANPTSAGQEVSGIQIFLSSATSVSLTSASGTQIMIGAGGAVSSPLDGTQIAADDWGASASGKTIYLATVGTGSTGTQPENLIIGAGPYTNANSSIMNFLPSIQGTGTFFLAVVGTPIISGVKFEFGTGPDSYLDGSPTGTGNQNTTPLPAALPLMGTVLGAGYLVSAWRRRRSGSADFAAA